MPVKQLQELCQTRFGLLIDTSKDFWLIYIFIFSKSEVNAGKVKVELVVEGKKYYGVGTNRKLVKIGAAKSVLNVLANKKANSETVSGQ